jgi:hypothetical protein
MTAQLLHRPDATQGHEGKQEKNVEAPVITLYLAEQYFGSFQQTIQQKRRQSAQDASLRYIQTNFKAHWGAIAYSESRKRPLLHARTGRAHALGSLRIDHVP